MRLASLTLAALATVATPALAQDASSHPLAGLTCMTLNLTPEQWQSGFMPPVFAKPDAASQPIGTIGGRFLAPTPLASRSGFVLVMRPDTSLVWLSEAYAKPYTASSCQPVQFANGRVGY